MLDGASNTDILPGRNDNGTLIGAEATTSSTAAMTGCANPALYFLTQSVPLEHNYQNNN